MDVKQPMWMHEHRDTLQIDKKETNLSLLYLKISLDMAS